MAPERPPNPPIDSAVSTEAVRERRSAELAESPEGVALVEAESYFMDKWRHGTETGKFLRELEGGQDKSENRAGLYGLVAMGGIAAALFGLPQAVQDNLSVLMDSNFSTLAEISTHVLGIGAAVIGVLESLQHFGEYLRKGRQIREIEQGTGQEAIA